MRLIVVVATLCAAVALCESSLAQGPLFGGFREGIRGSIQDGRVALRFDEPTQLSGVNLKSTGGLFVPIPPGTTAAPAGPFTFLLANNRSNISYAAIPGQTVELSGTWVTEVEYSGPIDGMSSDLQHSAVGDASFSQGPPVCFSPNFQACVPEPTTLPLTVIGLLGLLSIRGRRTNTGFGTRIEETEA